MAAAAAQPEEVGSATLELVALLSEQHREAQLWHQREVREQLEQYGAKLNARLEEASR